MFGEELVCLLGKWNLPVSRFPKFELRNLISKGSAGALAVVAVNHLGAPFIMPTLKIDDGTTIPSVMVSNETGWRLRSKLESQIPVKLRY